MFMLPLSSRPGVRFLLSTLIATVAVTDVRSADAEEAKSPRLVIAASTVTQTLDVPVPESVPIDSDRLYRLVEVDHPDVVIPVGFVPAAGPDGTVREGCTRLVAQISPRADASGPARTFELVFRSDDSGGPTDAFAIRDVSELSLGVYQGDAPVMVYNHGTIVRDDIPASENRRARGCYVHPVWGLGGEVLTDDFPRDHYHHHGIFWAWPHVSIDGKHHDLWLHKTIEPRFVRWLGRDAGSLAATLAVENGWFVGDAKVMIERVWLTAHRATDTSRVLDIRLVWIPVDRPVTLQGAGGKSYGGLTVRFKPGADRKETVITVADGPTTGDLPNTKLTWADFTSRFDNAAGPIDRRSGAAVFVSPDHPDLPPSWLTRHYGPLCVGYPGVKAKTFAVGEPIELNYRVWIHKSAATTEELKAAYQAYEAVAGAVWQP